MKVECECCRAICARTDSLSQLSSCSAIGGSVIGCSAIGCSAIGCSALVRLQTRGSRSTVLALKLGLENEAHGTLRVVPIPLVWMLRVFAYSFGPRSVRFCVIA